MGERPFAQRLGSSPIGDGPRDIGRSPADDHPALQGLARVSRELRLHAHDARGRSKRLEGRRHTAGQPPATDGHEDHRDIGHVLRDLQPDRALPGDDPIVVEWRDDREASLSRDRLRDSLAFIGRRADHDHLRTVGLHPGALHSRRIGRHDHDREAAQDARGAGDALGMVARGVGDDASRSLIRRECRDRVVGAADLERTDRLQALRLEELVIPWGPEGHQRRPDRDTMQDRGRGPDVFDGDERRWSGVHPGRVRRGGPRAAGIGS